MVLSTSMMYAKLC